MYRNAKLFIYENFKNAKDVIQYDDKGQGKVIGRGALVLTDYHVIFPTNYAFTWDVRYTIEITCKDGKYRYRLYDISINQIVTVTYDIETITTLTIDDAIKNTKKGSFKKVTTRLINSMLHNFENTQAAMKEYMAKKQVQSKDNF